MDYDTVIYSSLALSTLVCIGAVYYTGHVLKNMTKNIDKIKHILRNTKTLEAKVE